MGLTFRESFLKITMSKDSKPGYKGFGSVWGSTFTLEVASTSSKKAIEKLGISSYSQTVVPTSVTLGKNPETLTIEGVLCYLTPTGIGGGFLDQFTSHTVNTVFNVFIPCSIHEITSTSSPDAVGNWMVDSFKIRRQSAKRDRITFELVMLRWYGDMP